MPTALARVGASSSATKPKTPKVIDSKGKPNKGPSKKSGKAPIASGAAKNNSGPKSMGAGGGSGSIQGDLNNSERRAQTISSDANKNN